MSVSETMSQPASVETASRTKLRCGAYGLDLDLANDRGPIPENFDQLQAVLGSELYFSQMLQPLTDDDMAKGDEIVQDFENKVFGRISEDPSFLPELQEKIDTYCATTDQPDQRLYASFRKCSTLVGPESKIELIQDVAVVFAIGYALGHAVGKIIANSTKSTTAITDWDAAFAFELVKRAAVRPDYQTYTRTIGTALTDKLRSDQTSQNRLRSLIADLTPQPNKVGPVAVVITVLAVAFVVGFAVGVYEGYTDSKKG